MSDIDDAFTMVRQLLAPAPTLSFFDPLKQLGCASMLVERVLVQAGSRFLSDPESRYAIIELELIKCSIFLAGLPHFVVVTDQIAILINHQLDRKPSSTMPENENYDI